jgi:hypothetical protein
MSLFDDFDEDFADGSSEDAGDNFDYSMDDEFDQFRVDGDDDVAFATSDDASVSSSGGGVAGYLGQFTAGQRLILAFLLLVDVIAVSGALMVLIGVI